jgi:hypothetical protein
LAMSTFFFSLPIFVNSLNWNYDTQRE